MKIICIGQTNLSLWEWKEQKNVLFLHCTKVLLDCKFFFLCQLVSWVSWYQHWSLQFVQTACPVHIIISWFLLNGTKDFKFPNVNNSTCQYLVDSRPYVFRQGACYWITPNNMITVMIAGLLSYFSKDPTITRFRPVLSIEHLQVRNMVVMKE